MELSAFNLETFLPAHPLRWAARRFFIYLGLGVCGMAVAALLSLMPDSFLAQYLLPPPEAPAPTLSPPKAHIQSKKADVPSKPAFTPRRVREPLVAAQRADQGVALPRAESERTKPSNDLMRGVQMQPPQFNAAAMPPPAADSLNTRPAGLALPAARRVATSSPIGVLYCGSSNGPPGQRAGLETVGVLGGSPADRAGIHSGDLILSVNGRPVTDPGVLESFRRGTFGPTAHLEILRQGKPVQVTVAMHAPGR